MRALAAVLTCLASLAAAAQAPPFDHYDPVALSARAREAMREDDLSTACVLLSRAIELAPSNAQVDRARQEFLARQAGRPLPEEPAVPAPVTRAPAREAAAPRVLPPPPAPWPAR